MDTTDKTPEQQREDARRSKHLHWQLAGLRTEMAQKRTELEELQREERALLDLGQFGAATKVKNSTSLGPRKRQYTEETREKMRAAARKRWDKIKGRGTGSTSKKKGSAKGKAKANVTDIAPQTPTASAGPESTVVVPPLPPVQ